MRSGGAVLVVCVVARVVKICGCSGASVICRSVIDVAVFVVAVIVVVVIVVIAVIIVLVIVLVIFFVLVVIIIIVVAAVNCRIAIAVFVNVICCNRWCWQRRCSNDGC